MDGHRARKRFGQNFLVDASIVEAIADAVSPRAGERFVEIGPGLGALTQALLARFDASSLPLHAIEIDRDLVARLVKRHAPTALAIHEHDALAFDYAALAAQLGTPLRIVGNLPYNISSPLLFHLRAQRAHVVDQHFMLQREVVERMVAPAGAEGYGRLSVMLQAVYAMEALFDVPPDAFDPPPKVTSAIVRMRPLPPGEIVIDDEALFADLVRDAFAQRRKMLRNTLAPYAARVPLEDAGIDPRARAEDIALAQYVAYANRLAGWPEQ